MEYLPIAELEEWGDNCINPLNTKLLWVFAEDIDAYVWANPDTDTRKLLETIGECCSEAGLHMGEA